MNQSTERNANRVRSCQWPITGRGRLIRIVRPRYPTISRLSDLMPSAAPVMMPKPMTSRIRGVGRSRLARIRKNIAPAMKEASGMPLVWLYIAPYHEPHSASAMMAKKAARGPAISRVVAPAAAIPPMPISAHSRCRSSY